MEPVGTSEEDGAAYNAREPGFFETASIFTRSAGSGMCDTAFESVERSTFAGLGGGVSSL